MMDTSEKGACYTFAELTAPEIRALAGDAVTILPIAAIEQHGKHLCTGTDTFINDALQSRIFDNPPPGRYLVLPTLWLGASEHHLDYGGTLSLRPTTYVSILVDLITNLAEAGHRRILLLNSHGGNHAPMQAALAECARTVTSFNVFVAGLTYWEIAADRWKSHVPDLGTIRMGHACELETSMIWASKPGLKRVEPSAESPFPEELEIFKSVALPFPRLTKEGHMGAPGRANSAKGEALLHEATLALREYLTAFSAASLPEATL